MALNPAAEFVAQMAGRDQYSKVPPALARFPLERFTVEVGAQSVIYMREHELRQE